MVDYWARGIKDSIKFLGIIIKVLFRASTKEHFTKANNVEMMALFYYHTEQFENLENLVDDIPAKNQVLIAIGDMLASVGLCTAAAKSYAKVRFWLRKRQNDVYMTTFA